MINQPWNSQKVTQIIIIHAGGRIVGKLALLQKHYERTKRERKAGEKVKTSTCGWTDGRMDERTDGCNNLLNASYNLPNNFSNFCKSITDRPTDRQTGRQVDWWMDLLAYRDAKMHLKRKNKGVQWCILVGVLYYFFFLKKRLWADRLTDRPRDGQTQPLIEKGGRI